MKTQKVVIVAAKRTPIGSFMGGLSSVEAPKLGARAIKGALDSIGLSPDRVDEVFMGNVLQSGLGQAPARQAVLYAGVSENTPCTTINKVCASGMKAITLAAQAIALGDINIAVAGGMENMSLAPHLMSLRKGLKFGSASAVDSMQKDGLLDPFDQVAMGVFADATAVKHSISRLEQDVFAVESYTKSTTAWKEGKMKEEVVPVNVPQRKGSGSTIQEDEEYKNVVLDKIPLIGPAFSKEGTVTAANASTLNDGAAALVLMSEKKATELKLKPMAWIEAYADAAQQPKWFTTAPAKALPKALSKANRSLDEIDLFEFNEAFSVVGLANCKILDIDPKKVNVHGGAVSLGHPLGCSGARIVVTLIHAMNDRKVRLGAATICNGGGGATAMILTTKNEPQ
ncbi:MAG: thiolase family protein [Flavobacteriaceae bacterium]